MHRNKVCDSSTCTFALSVLSEGGLGLVILVRFGFSFWSHYFSQVEIDKRDFYSNVLRNATETQTRHNPDQNPSAGGA